ncbi:MAG: hypothetical protein PHI99_06185 [Syntrophales bacterium]|nr:hypothetical protein [Methanoregulaceae archaeon]MDD4997720.1 hypothetical protein [Syntrophales bacterium]
MQAKTFKFKADGGDITLILGFVPDYLRLVNVTAADAGDKMILEWFGALMGDGVEVEHKVIADNGSTGDLNINYASSGGYVAAADKDDVSISTSEEVYDVATVKAVGGDGVKITASGFMADNDIIYGLAICSDASKDIGDIADLGSVIVVN